MKQPVDFVKTTILGGALIILPVVLVLFVLIETVDMLVIVTDPIVEHLPVETIGGVEIATVLAVLIILAACFFAGLAAKSEAAAKLGSWFENAVLGKIPMYPLIKSVTRGFSSASSHHDRLKPAVLKLADQTSVLVAVIEERDDGHATVFIPSTPMPTVGEVRFVSRDRLEPIDASLGDMAEVIMQWEYGAGALIDAGEKNKEPGDGRIKS